MGITSLKYSQVSSLLLYFSPSLMFFPREERNMKIQYFNKALSLIEHKETLDRGKQRRVRMKIKEKGHITSNGQGHKLFLYILI